MKIIIPINKRNGAGFTLVELMVSMVLGIVLVGGVAGMYLETRKNMAQDDEMARLQENARYVMELLRYEIASSGFFAGLKDSDALDPVAITSECVAGGVDWALDIFPTMEFVSDYGGGAIPQSSFGTSFECLDPGELQTNSDIISLKRTADTPTLKNGEYTDGESEDLDQWYLRAFDYTNYSWQYLSTNIDAGEATSGSTYDYWEYYVKIYFLRNYSEAEDDEIPTFCQIRLVGGNMEDECLVEGVEEMHFEIGVDELPADELDGVADRYVSNPTSDDIQSAVSIRVHLLLRSINEIYGYTNEKSYTLGGRSVDPFNDGYIRKVFTTTVKLRNNFNS